MFAIIIVFFTIQKFVISGVVAKHFGL